MIILPDTHSPHPVERLDEYLANLSNHIERVFKEGGDPREVMANVARRAERGTEIQLQLMGMQQ